MTLFATNRQGYPSWEDMAVSLDEPLAAPDELTLVTVLSKAIRQSASTLSVGIEISSHGRSRIDFVFVIPAESSGENNVHVVGVEAKLTNWSRAFRQAYLNRLAVDVSFIALPIQNVSPSVVRMGIELGIGILGVAADQIHLVLPAHVGRPDSLLRDRVVSQLSKNRTRRTRPALPQLIEVGG